ncbi:hypothetical protein ICM05_07400 [Leucobacter sp. cx-42]|uniref:TetR/AcrR family transcriptional regulator n=1 Tax=unclassified Leucobacter TaxID=2621730 RepID=UPI00165DB8B7|nr:MULTISPECIES: hypothetical protein [unclassified Leucobacter]MBC9954473.1 hypothetical protein [Leucobacter sp. cx-42]
MARPRTSSTDEIISRIALFLAEREWPTATWSLAEISPAAGLSPAGLMKRFGSRDGILDALGSHWLAHIPEQPRSGADPVSELRTFLLDTFAAPTAVAATASLTELLRDSSRPTAAATLREGQARQARYVAQLLALADPPLRIPAATAAELLLDACSGILLRTASGDTTSVVHTLDTCLELFRK